MCSSRAWRSSAICYLCLVFVSPNRRLMWNHANAQHTQSEVSTRNNFQFSCFSFFVSALDIARASRVCVPQQRSTLANIYIRIQVEWVWVSMSAIVLCGLTLRKTPPAIPYLPVSFRLYKLLCRHIERSQRSDYYYHHLLIHLSLSECVFMCILYSLWNTLPLFSLPKSKYLAYEKA